MTLINFLHVVLLSMLWFDAIPCLIARLEGDKINKCWRRGGQTPCEIHQLHPPIPIVRGSIYVRWGVLYFLRMSFDLLLVTYNLKMRRCEWIWSADPRRRSPLPLEKKLVSGLFPVSTIPFVLLDNGNCDIAVISSTLESNSCSIALNFDYFCCERSFLSHKFFHRR